MKVKFRNRVNPSEHREELQKAIEWYLDRYSYLKDIDHTLYLYILEKNPNSNGTYFYIDKNTSKIHIYKRSVNHMISTLFHELTHLRQHVDNRVRFDMKDMIRYFDDAPFPLIDYDQLTYDMYLSTPWEVEAREEQLNLSADYRIENSRTYTAIQNLVQKIRSLFS